MAPSIVHLPNGQTLTVNPVFGGLGFKANDLHTHHNVFPPGWTIILNSEDDEDDHHPPTASQAAHTVATRAVAETIGGGGMDGPAGTKHHIHRFRKPSLRNDHLFISSISNPSNNDFKPASSPTRQIAMMLWASLWWYFHQPQPDPHLLTPASANTPEDGRPKGEWRVNINREGIFKGKHLLPKLERMGLISSDDSTVGLDPEDGVRNAGEGWTRMFVSQRSFWQLDPRIYLFSLAPTAPGSPFPSVSPASSRPASPSRRPDSQQLTMTRAAEDTGASPFFAAPTASINGAVVASHHAPPLSRHNTPPFLGPFTSSSHLPTFYPPPPLQYIFTNNIRHPVRPKPFRQGETFYTRYIPSLGQYLSFRVASLSRNPCSHRGPVSTSASQGDVRFGRPLPGAAAGSGDQTIPTVAGLNLGLNNNLDGRATPPPRTDRTERFPSYGGNLEDTAYMTDTELLNKWMNDPRVSYSWGEQGPMDHQTNFLSNNMTSRHSFPVIGSFDGKPFGYFEIYWVKEDQLAKYIGDSGVGDYDRGLHCLVGEQEFRGRHRVKVWLSALVHYCFLADLRTETVFMEPRVDNTKLLDYSKDAGFVKTGEVSFPHKQSNLLKARRENWEAPAI